MWGINKPETKLPSPHQPDHPPSLRPPPLHPANETEESKWRNTIHIYLRLCCCRRIAPGVVTGQGIMMMGAGMIIRKINHVNVHYLNSAPLAQAHTSAQPRLAETQYNNHRWNTALPAGGGKPALRGASLLHEVDADWTKQQERNHVEIKHPGEHFYCCNWMWNDDLELHGYICQK